MIAKLQAADHCFYVMILAHYSVKLISRSRMSNKQKIILSFFFQVFIFCSYGQNPHLQFDHLSTADGLSLNNVQSIIQDHRGFMWFGTPDGLNKYDGYRFTVFKNNPADSNSLSYNFIRCLANSKNGGLWVATMAGGLCLYDHNKEHFIRFRHDAKNINTISDDNVNAVWEDENENVWIGTSAGLDMFNQRQNKFVHFKKQAGNNRSLGDNYVRSIFEDARHNLWIATQYGGINLLNKKDNSFIRFEHDVNNPTSICYNNIITIFEDSQQRLWIGSDGHGMDYFDRKNGIFHHYRKDENNTNSLAADAVYAFNEDAEKNLWIGTENGGLSVFNFKNNQFTTYQNDDIDKESISNNSLYSIYRDQKNNMWLGNYSGGIDLAGSDKSIFFHYKHMMQKNSLSHNNVLSIEEDSKHKLWIGTDGGGLNLFDPITGSFAHFRHDKNNKNSICGDYVLATLADSKGNIWVGTWGDGLTQYNPAQKTWRHFKYKSGDSTGLNCNNIRKIYEDKQKNIWICTYGGGLNLLNEDGTSFTHFVPDSQNPTSISYVNIESVFEDSEDNFWVCTDGGGVDLFNKKNKTFTNFAHDATKNSISNNSVSSVMEDANKNLWFCTYNGLNKYSNKTKKFASYTTADGLPGNVIMGIVQDHNKNYWISTTNGISFFNPLTRIFKNYSIADGLQSQEFKEQAVCKTASGILYFGGVNGFNQFNPDTIHTISFEPPLVITNFLVFNKNVPIGLNGKDAIALSKSITETKTITLPYSSSVFSFEFASLNYTSNEKKKYAYMLENFDKDWNDAGTERMATYTNLDPGEYTFKVKGLNNEGIWSPKIVSIKLIIKPPFYLTWWFKLLVLFTVTGGIVALYMNRVAGIRKQQMKLQQQVDEKTRQLVLANNDLTIKNKELEQFAYVASHDLQEPLRTTTGFVSLLQQQYKGKLDERADKYLSFLSEASNRMRVLIADLLDFSRIGSNKEFERVNCNVILKNVKEDIMIAVNETGAAIESDTLPVINGHAFEIQILFQNLILNAIKFRKKNTAPQIIIGVSKINRYWQFAFKDNGIGIEAQYTQRIFDIFQRLHTRAEYEGSGIGLSHCKKIVELHYGKIWVESALGEGSTFYFTIPDNKPVA
jgi:ligand-binding sensor domain-containing protein/signal transduction histidine kinase